MKHRCVAALSAALVVCPPGAAAGEGLTLEAALTLAHERSPALMASRRRVAEAEARAASRPALRDNPSLAAGLGARERPGSDYEIELRQTFELGGRVGARRDIERAALARETADAAAVRQAVLRDVRLAFLRGLHAAERVRLSRTQEDAASELAGIARRRLEAGDIALLEMNVAASARARATAERLAAEAAQTSALTELRVLVGLAPEEPSSLAGELRAERAYDAAGLLAAIGERPEVRSLEAQLREAEAEARLGRGLAWPDLSPSVRYERDAGERVLWAGLSVTLPVFDRGRQLQAGGRARVDGLRAELAARRRAAASQVAGALTLHGLRAAAVRELGANTDRLAESEALARRSYDVGEIGLGELLLVRRETTEARREWLDSLLELAQVRAELDALSGESR